jgi:hypothetical protein
MFQIPQYCEGPQYQSQSSEWHLFTLCCYQRNVLSTRYAIPKKWKWVGALLVNTGGDHVKRLSVVSLTDLTADPPNGLSFNIVLPTTVHSIEITRMLNIADLDPLLSACGPFRQVAKLAAENINDRELFCSLASLMDDRQQVCNLLLTLNLRS